MRIFGIILAGGAGRRMGGADKASLHLGGQRLIDLAIARMHPQVTALAISANGGTTRFGIDLPVLPDDSQFGPFAGPLAGLHAGMCWAQSHGGEYLATAAVDTPYFPCDLVARLRLALEQQAGSQVALATGATAKDARVHGTFGLWPVALHGDLAQFLTSGAKAKVQDFAARHSPTFAEFADETEFANINTPEDLAHLAALIENNTAGA